MSDSLWGFFPCFFSSVLLRLLVVGHHQVFELVEVQAAVAVAVVSVTEERPLDVDGDLDGK
jgi:hypothetical protein